MTDVKNSRLYKTLKKAVRKEDRAELLRMLEMVPEKAMDGSPWGKGLECQRLINAFWWDETPQGHRYWNSLHDRLIGAGHDQ